MMGQLHLEDRDPLQWQWPESCLGSNSENSRQGGFPRGSWSSWWSPPSPPRTTSSSTAGHPSPYPASNFSSVSLPFGHTSYFTSYHICTHVYLHVHVGRRRGSCLAIVASYCHAVHCPIKSLQDSHEDYPWIFPSHHCTKLHHMLWVSIVALKVCMRIKLGFLIGRSLLWRWTMKDAKLAQP